MEIIAASPTRAVNPAASIQDNDCTQQAVFVLGKILDASHLHGLQNLHRDAKYAKELAKDVLFAQLC